jgi:hypothetical protein
LCCVGLCVFVFMHITSDNSVPIIESKETAVVQKCDPQAVDLLKEQGKLDTGQDDHRFCHTPTIENIQNQSVNPIPVGYQCQGEAYDCFAMQMMEYIRVQQGTSNVTTWGRRPYPIPANKTIFVLGNSHTRQTFNSMICQYADKLVSIDNPCDFATIVRFHNHGVLILSTNSPLVFAHNWFELYKKCLHGETEANNSGINLDMYELDDFDAVVIGQVNQYNPNSKGNYLKGMLNYTATIPEVDIVNIPSPSVEDVVQLFPNHTAIVVVASFAVSMQKILPKSALQAIQNHTERSNIVCLSGRKHINTIGIECGSNDHNTVGICGDGQTAHRCTGKYGGHADLIAWDVIETLYTLIK